MSISLRPSVAADLPAVASAGTNPVEVALIAVVVLLVGAACFAVASVLLDAAIVLSARRRAAITTATLTGTSVPMQDSVRLIPAVVSPWPDLVLDSVSVLTGPATSAPLPVTTDASLPGVPEVPAGARVA